MTKKSSRYKLFTSVWEVDYGVEIPPSKMLYLQTDEKPLKIGQNSLRKNAYKSLWVWPYDLKSRGDQIFELGSFGVLWGVFRAYYGHLTNF